jgi:hypothetical protein
MTREVAHEPVSHWAQRAGELAILVSLAALVEGCGPASRSVFEKMHEGACSGDADKFFAYVAEDKLVESIAKMGAIAAGHSPDLVAGTMYLGADALQSIERSAALAAIDDWRKDIAKGKDGDVCGWSFVGAEKIADRERAEIRSKAGNKKYLYFATVDGQMKLVGFQAVESKADGAAVHSAPGR